MAASTSSESLINLLKQGENVVSSECKTLLKTLPSEQGWISASKYHLYQGFWYPPLFLNGLLSVQKNFRPNRSDILVATSPKSGTTWLKALVFALINRSQHNPSNPLLQNNPHDLIPFLEFDLFVINPNPDLSSFAEPRLFSTHIPFSSLPDSVTSSHCKIVYLCRNPKDTVVSWWHFIKRVEPISLEDAVDRFCRGLTPFGPFWDHVLEYWKASQEMPHNVLFLKYEEIKKQPHEELRKLAHFLGCPFSPEEETNGQVEEISNMCSFESLSGLQVNKTGNLHSRGRETNSYFRQGKVGDSANYLTPEMIHRLDSITKEKFSGSTLNLE